MLVYDQPIDQAKPAAPPAPPRPSAAFSVLELTRLLWQRKVAIAAAGLICACAAVMVGKSLTPRYSATAQLYVDPRELQLVERELTPRAQDTSGLAMVVESQARLITSNNVLLQVIRDTKLDKDPEFGGDAKSLMSSLLGLFGFDAPTAEDTKLAQMRRRGLAATSMSEDRSPSSSTSTSGRSARRNGDARQRDLRRLSANQEIAGYRRPAQPPSLSR
jgi:uncharacterized protein involved in exopolysaccharide biosynthesis